MKIEISPQDQISEFDEIAERFFQVVLNMNYSEILITDLSELSDFTFCGDFDDIPGGVKAWDQWVIKRIRDCYEIEIEKTTINLVDLFNRIKQAERRVLH